MSKEEMKDYPPCPNCKTNIGTRKAGTAIRQGCVYQAWKCKTCKKSWL